VLSILSMLPGLLDLNGDAQNALVLAQRARWAGHAARVDAFAPGDPAPAIPDIVVVGSGAETGIPLALEAMRGIRNRMNDWVRSGVPLLAVGTGMEMLSDEIELSHGGSLAGLGILPGRAVRREARVSDDIVIDSEFGRLVGYENHVRGFALPDGARPFGTVIRGVGNGDRDAAAGAVSRVRTEGIRVDNAMGTHLHGPLLAKNPEVADFLLRATTIGDRYDARTVPGGRVDDSARAARNLIAARLGLESE